MRVGDGAHRCHHVEVRGQLGKVILSYQAGLGDPAQSSDTFTCLAISAAPRASILKHSSLTTALTKKKRN